MSECEWSERALSQSLMLSFFLSLSLSFFRSLLNSFFFKVVGLTRFQRMSGGSGGGTAQSVECTDLARLNSSTT